TAPRIRTLPAPAAARLRSSLAVTSLADAVSELVQNSLDAGARTVAVQANVARNSCVVEDDGAGILPADVAMVGRATATSKYNNPAPATRTFGSRGLALSSLSTHSLFTLTTRHATCATTHTTRISYSTPLTAAGPSPPHLRLPRPGTTVRIDALHADLPVRFHARLAAATANPDAEWATITRRAAHLLLLAPSAVSFTARDEHGARRIAVRAPPATTTATATATTGRTGSWRMAVLRQVYGRAAVGADWERVRAGTATTTIRGHVSAAKGHGTRGLQFLAVNGHPLVGAASALHAEANRVFAASSFGCEDGEGRRKGVERWPMFVLEVECAAGAEVLGGEGGTEGKGGLEGAWLAGAVELLGRLVAEFLRAHGFSTTAAAEGVKRPIEGGVRGRGRGGGGGGGRAGTPLRTITNGSAAVNHGDTRALALWSRVKAAKHDAREEDGRKGGGFSAGMATARRSSTTDTDTDTDTRDIATSSSSPDDSSKENEDGSGGGGAGAGDSHGLWRDPRSKHVFRVNARTGNNSPATTARKRALSLSSSAAFRTAKKPRTEEEEEEKEARGPFVDALLKNWTNPVFPRTEAPIPSTTQRAHHHHCGPSSSSSSSPFTTTTTQPRAALGKLTKPGLATATVLAQLDRKYILLKMRGLSSTTTTTTSSSSSSPSTPTLLVLLDQHAASERIRTEALLSSLAAAEPQRLAAPLHYALADDGGDAALMHRYEGVFRAWGVHCAVVAAPGQGQGKGQGQILAITALPAAVADRCVGEPALALAMVRRHVYALVEGGKKCSTTGGEGGDGGGDWVKGLAGCPVGLVEMVNSRACRGAVMFGDALGMEECVSLVRALAGCRFPFMCAHGRPSMVPLVDLGVEAVEERRRSGSGGFKKDFGEWMERRKD
ncbi:hypothetical protein DFP73DRAFT_611507, partial [Morchella snyderi]